VNSTQAAASVLSRRSKVWASSLWLAQILLAVVFGMAGAMKATAPVATLAQQMVWPGDVPAWLVRFIGVSELAGALGLILPAATRVTPGLTPLAALALVAVMLLAAVFHIARGEWQALPMNVVLGGLAVFIAWGRTRKAPIQAR
jgi:uncharacterized membrane protein YphA (DoxX/SURF4 family)